MKFGLVDVLILAVLFAAFALLTCSFVAGLAYDYDEADYILAARQGIWANYTDRDAIPVGQFVDLGLRAVRKQIDRITLSEFIRKSNDISMLRHYHGPTYFYYLAAARTVVPDTERGMRGTTLALVALTALVAYLGCFWLLEQGPRIAAVIAATLILASPATIFTGAIITPHMAYALMVTLTLVLLARFVQTGRLGYWWATAALLALCFVTFEYAVMALLTALAVLVLHRRALFAGWTRARVIRFAGQSLGVFLLAFAVAWPTGIFKLMLPRSYAFLSFVASKREPWPQTQAEVWLERILQSPVEWGLLIVLVLAALVGLLRRTNKWVWLSPFIVYAAIHIGSTFINKSPSPKHVSSALPALFIVCGVMAARLLAARSRGLQVAAPLVLAAGMILNTWAHDLGPRLLDRWRATRYVEPVVRYFQTNEPTGQRLLVHRQYQASLKCYFPNLDQSWYLQKADAADIAERAIAGRFDGLLYDGTDYAALRERLAPHVLLDETFIAADDGETPRGQVVYARLRPRGDQAASQPASSLSRPSGG